MGPVTLAMSEKLSEEIMQQECPAGLTGGVDCQIFVRENGDSSDGRKQMTSIIRAGGPKLWEQLQRAINLSRKYQTNLEFLETGDGLKRVSPSQRDTAVNNLRCLHKFYGFAPETLALAVNLLDRFLGKVKAQPKYLSCITTSCYYIALKVLEESHDIPCSTELIHLSQSGCTVKDLIRMEGIILDKLNWDLHNSNSLTILLRLFAILSAKFPQDLDNVFLHLLIAKLEVCMGCFQLLKHQAATIALSVLSCVLEDTQIEPRDSWTAVIELQTYCKINDCDFIHCRGLAADYLDLYYSRPPATPKLRIPSTRYYIDKKRPSYYADTDLPTITEAETVGSADEDVMGREKEDGCLTGDSGMECDGSVDSSFSETSSTPDICDDSHENLLQIPNLICKLQTPPTCSISQQ